MGDATHHSRLSLCKVHRIRDADRYHTGLRESAQAPLAGAEQHSTAKSERPILTSRPLLGGSGGWYNPECGNRSRMKIALDSCILWKQVSPL